MRWRDNWVKGELWSTRYHRRVRSRGVFALVVRDIAPRRYVVRRAPERMGNWKALSRKAADAWSCSHDGRKRGGHLHVSSSHGSFALGTYLLYLVSESFAAIRSRGGRCYMYVVIAIGKLVRVQKCAASVKSVSVRARSRASVTKFFFFFICQLYLVPRESLLEIIIELSLFLYKKISIYILSFPLIIIRLMQNNSLQIDMATWLTVSRKLSLPLSRRSQSRGVGQTFIHFH